MTQIYGGIKTNAGASGLKIVPSSDLVAMEPFAGDHPVRVDLVYAHAGHPENIFGKIYRDEARLWLHRDLAAIVLKAGDTLKRERGWRLVLKDGLRTVEAQQFMQQAEIVRRNPHWLEGPDRLLSPPGQGAHPRAMAIDLVPETLEGLAVDMGTAFDFLSENPQHNPAARAFRGLPAIILENRAALEAAMIGAARDLGLPLFPLPSEWWDFRFPADFYGQYAPLRDADLPEDMRMSAARQA